MKLGTESRNKAIIAAVLMVIAIAVIGNALFGGSGSGSGSANPAPADSLASTTVAPRKGKKAAMPRSLDPRLRYDWLKASEDKKYEGNSRNIFLAQAEIPTPVVPVADSRKHDDTPQGLPPPPPINLKFFGFANRAGEPKKIFLSQGEDVFIAREGDIVDRRYRVVHISPTSVEIEDVLNNNRQSIPLTQG